MNWKRLWADGKWVAVSASCCVTAFALNGLAWRAGSDANALRLAGCLLLRVPLLLAVWLALVAVFSRPGPGEQPSPSSGFTVLHLVVLLLILPGCFGFYALWPVVLTVLVLLFLLRLAFRRAALRENWRTTVIPPFVVVVLFFLTWDQSSSMTRQALHGLGHRIDALGDSERLLAWAEEVIAATPRDYQDEPRTQELPPFVEELLGPRQGVRGAVVTHRDDPSVTLYTGGSAFHFQIRIRPSGAVGESPPWWVGEAGSVEWRPGLVLETAGK